MTANEYQTFALRTKNPDLHDLSQLQDGLMGLNGEAGECIDHLKKAMFQGHELDCGALAKELGDVAWYLAISADAIGLTLDEIFEINLAKLRARYPSGFSEDRSIYRTPEDI